MRRVRSADTGPERLLRSRLHRLGFRFRVNRRDLPGTPDIVFPSRRKVVFVHGCFWHGHGCKRGDRTPKSNTEYWRRKIARNAERDGENARALAERGWRSFTVWECDLKDAAAATARVVEFLESREGG